MTDIDDPWQVLQLRPDASHEQIRAAYLRLVRQYPPDRDAAAFERIRDAYQKARDPDYRSRQRLFGPTALEDIEELQQLLRSNTRHPVGAEAWLAVIKDNTA